MRVKKGILKYKNTVIYGFSLFDSMIAEMMFKLLCVIAILFVAVVLGQEDHQDDEHFANFLHSNDHIHNKE